MKPVAPLSISIKPSRRLQVILCLAHGAAAAAVLVASLPSWLAAVLLLLIGASLAGLRRTSPVEGLRHTSPVEGLLLSGDGGLEIVGVGGTASAAIVHPHTIVLAFLVVLLYRQQGRLRSLTLLADSLAAEDFRQLRLWLRWRSKAAVAP